MDSMDKIYVSIDGDGIGQLVGRASLSNDEAGLMRISTLIQAGNEIFRSWVEKNFGKIISLGGDEGRMSVPPAALGDIPALREQYQNLTGNSVSVGIGHTMAEADKALLAAKLTGKDKVTLFGPEVDKIIAEAKPKDENEKIYDEYLKSEGADLEKAQKDFLTKLLELSENEIEDTDADRKNKFKEELLETLEEIKEFAPHIEQIQTQNPELYQAFLKLVQSTLKIAQENSPKEESASLEKATLPVGAQKDCSPSTDLTQAGKIKIQHDDGTKAWVSGRSGLVQSADGHPISSRNQEGK